MRYAILTSLLVYLIIYLNVAFAAFTPFPPTTPPAGSISAKGNLLSSDGVNQAEFVACADGKVLEYLGTETQGLLCGDKTVDTNTQKFGATITIASIEQLGSGILATFNYTSPNTNPVEIRGIGNTTGNSYVGVRATNCTANDCAATFFMYLTDNSDVDIGGPNHMSAKLGSATGGKSALSPCASLTFRYTPTVGVNNLKLRTISGGTSGTTYRTDLYCDLLVREI